MLLAEIHGKRLSEARDSEDYLTSAVFGHLRYVPPAVLWPDLFAAAKGLPGPGGREQTLAGFLTANGCDVKGCNRLTVSFWPYRPPHGEPDLLLEFDGGLRPIRIVIEVKQSSWKSGSGGDRDQLVRYLRYLDDEAKASNAETALIYLTPRESLGEVEESADASKKPDKDRQRLFRLQWQDVLEQSEHAAKTSLEPFRLILTSVAAFLDKLLIPAWPMSYVMRQVIDPAILSRG